jgi:hypothetical protein
LFYFPAYRFINFFAPCSVRRQSISLGGGFGEAVKFSLLNPAIVVLPTDLKKALTKTQQHGVCAQNY